MLATVLIEFDDVTEHVFDSIELALLNDKGQQKSQADAAELFFFNFDTDDDTDPKRGIANLSLLTTADITTGFLNLTEDDGGRAIISPIINAALTTAFSFLFKLKVNFSANVATRDILVLKSRIDSSQVRINFSGSSPNIKINIEVKNNSGNVIFSGVVLTRSYSVGDVVQIGFAKDAMGSKVTIDGVGAATPPIFIANMGDCEILFGDSGNTNWSYDDFQFFNDMQDFETGGIIAEPVSFDNDELTMLTVIPFLLDEVTDLNITDAIPAGAQLKHVIHLDLAKFWHDGAAWVASNGMLAQANTSAEIKANVTTFPLVKGLGAILSIAHIFKSDDGYATALIEKLSVDFTFQFKSSEVATCLVFGTVFDNAKHPVEGAVIRVLSADRFINGAFIGPNSQTKTDIQGKFSISIPETETAETTVDINIEYTQKSIKKGVEFDDKIVHEIKGVVVPNVLTAKLSTLTVP